SSNPALACCRRPSRAPAHTLAFSPRSITSIITALAFAFRDGALQHAGKAGVTHDHDGSRPLADPRAQARLVAPAQARDGVLLRQAKEAPSQGVARVLSHHDEFGLAAANGPLAGRVPRRQFSRGLGETENRSGIHVAASKSARRWCTSAGMACCRARSKRLPCQASSR